MPRAYAYLRCSHEDSAKSGAGIAAQETSVLRQYADFSDIDHELFWGSERFAFGRAGFFHDSAVSAFKRPLFERPAGKALLKVLKAGDVIFVHRVDRMFRNMRDMAAVMSELRRRRVRVRFGDIPMDIGTPLGEMMLSILVLMGEWESKLKGMRQREAAAVRKAIREENAGRRKRGAELLYPVSLYTPHDRKTTRSDPGVLATLPPKESAADDSTPRPGRIFLYVRCSHLDSVESGLGLEWQKRCCLAAAEKLRAENPLLTICEEPFVDEAVSAWKNRLVKRPSGKRLDKILQAGDIVLFARLDRGFRSTVDMGDTLRAWKERGAGVRFVSEGLDLSTVWGRAVIDIMAKFAEIESELTSSRTKESLAELRKEGRGIHRLFGFNWAISNGVRSLVPDRREIALARLAYWCHKHCGVSLFNTARVIERVMAKREGRPAVPLQGWTIEKAQREFGNDTWKPLVCSRPGKIPLVQPYWAPMTIRRAIARWPLIREYLLKQRMAAKTEPAGSR